MVHHGAWLRKYGFSEDSITALSTGDPLTVELEPGAKALIEYALKLTRRPGDMGKEDVDRLRRAGFDDLAIHDACQVVAYFNFVNRVADGLGVELQQDKLLDS